ncbi:MAG: hypothetical protein KBT34_06705 [Prevotella sp.]|nr:hypothetical protein [Candidatus Prevotella equi]
MEDSLLSSLSQLRALFKDAAPTDAKTINDYAWLIAKTLLQHVTEIDALTARQLLADYIKLPVEKPSRLHSAILSAAIKVADKTNDFHFIPFLELWGPSNLREEDYVRQVIPSTPSGPNAGKTFPSLAEKVVKAYAKARLLRPEEDSSEKSFNMLSPLFEMKGYDMEAGCLNIRRMLVTRIKEAVSKEGRKLIFVTLTSPEGINTECISSALVPHPLHPLPEGKRHYVNIGQMYDCILRHKKSDATDPTKEDTLTISDAYLSPSKPQDFFKEEFGYIESIDQQHSHMHIYDGHSRHFVAPILRFSKEQAGDFVRFIPIIPLASKFKSAIIIGKASVTDNDFIASPLIRQIKITSIYAEKHYASWTLTDESQPITELLSPYQLSQGETSQSFTKGFISLTEDNLLPSYISDSKETLSLSATYNAVIYLRRGKDGVKRPHVSKVNG